MLFLSALIAAASPSPLAAQWEEGKNVPYVVTPPEVVEAMLNLAQVKAGDFVVDLGCGDGRIVIMAAQKFGARGKGVDFNPKRIREARENARKARVTARVVFVRGDFFDADIHEATVVALYLLPDINVKLRPKLVNELQPGARIVSHSFGMGGWEPDRTIEQNGRIIRLWTVTPKAKAAYGHQHVPQGGEAAHPR
jgi:SAM-dependent methyltransferase